MSVLDDIVAGATEESVSTANLLRKVIVVSHRIKATAVQRWAETGLNGYNPNEPESLPAYRGPLPARARGVYWRFAFQRGVTVASRSQFGLPA